MKKAEKQRGRSKVLGLVKLGSGQDGLRFPPHLRKTNLNQRFSLILQLFVSHVVKTQQEPSDRLGCALGSLNSSEVGQWEQVSSIR